MNNRGCSLLSYVIQLSRFLKTYNSFLSEVIFQPKNNKYLADFDDSKHEHHSAVYGVASWTRMMHIPARFLFKCRPQYLTCARTTHVAEAMNSFRLQSPKFRPTVRAAQGGPLLRQALSLRRRVLRARKVFIKANPIYTIRTHRIKRAMRAQIARSLAEKIRFSILTLY